MHKLEKPFPVFGCTHHPQPAAAFRAMKLGRLILLLISFLVLSSSLVGCGWNPFKSIGENAGKEAAETIAQTIEDIIPQLTGESAQWREEWQDTRQELPEDVRQQFDLAFQNAIDAAGTEFKCSTDFIRSRLKTDLGILVATFRNQNPPAKSPRICSVFPDEVLELDGNLRPKNQEWIKFAGYDFTDVDGNLNVRVLLESEDGSTDDLTRCCVDSPTHYVVTVDFDETEFSSNARRLTLSSSTGQLGRSVAISHAPPPAPQSLPDEYWTDAFSEEGSGEMTCASGFAVAGVSCSGDRCDKKRLLCRPYLPSQDEARRAYWHPQVISEEQPNASFRTDSLPQPSFVGGLKCSGGFCDNISFFVIETPHLTRTGQWEWKPFFSEESPGVSICNQNQFLTGVGCKGDNCDNVALHCSTVRFGNGN